MMARSSPVTASQSRASCRCVGPWVSSGLFQERGRRRCSLPDGWFDTGDIATLDAEGYLRLTDRAKDVIKSGGEWISTLDLEDAVCSHPAVAMAAAIGVPHPKWDERPLLLVVLRPGHSADPEVLKAHVGERVAKLVDPGRGADCRGPAHRSDRQGAEARIA